MLIPQNWKNILSKKRLLSKAVNIIKKLVSNAFNISGNKKMFFPRNFFIIYSNVINVP